ncbi:RNA-binding protein 44-like isoform X1 [Cygnus olor]|uniref:RNA-binding protein 44-like isoform X1 n=1 Tax=Cygnus olor TaxID=8869 RepID=UPI001ADE9E8A|nr:RNA-binding protein 44-like isoform X1 [Cygnus olor]XP_040417541.1 RNA-binding protein 44-like isoform X1 [Cygnus olor]XP_040417542.1 RNA-binding protein 44-like isoform X1 [Cygnus olor]XP_040417543.1 RNA-binding protein 44-like isoform X1 [Cygnus olor]XP_040417544.1 RNA-binding protein 44-like isoform X1 [Cygnus olor]
MELQKSSDVKSKMRGSVQTSHLFSYSEKAQQTLIRDPAAGANVSGFGQAHCASVSDLELQEESLPCLSSSLDADIEMYNKKRKRVCCEQVEESKKESGTLGRVCSDTRSNCGVCDGCRQIRVGEEDSQLEYISANEQEPDGRDSSGELSEQWETVGIKTLKLMDPAHQVPGGGAAKEQSPVDVVEDCSAPEYCIGDQVHTEEAVPELPQLLQDSLLVCSSTSCDHKEEHTACNNVLYGNILESHACGGKERVYPNLLMCDGLENGEVKDAPLVDGTHSPLVAPNKEVSEQNDRHVHSMAVKQENPLLPPRKAPARATQLCKSTRDCNFYSCEEPLACMVVSTESRLFGVEVADQSGRNASSLSLEPECCENLINLTSNSKVNQAVDASSDFRACFTTSRSTSARVHLMSRAVNTEITMMNKSRPAGWHHETCTDAACYRDGPCGAGSVEDVGSQLNDTLGKHPDGNTATAERSSQMKEQWESKAELRSGDLKLNNDRPIHLNKQTVKNSVSSYCQNLLQRAVEAELQILTTHYQMCYQHCLKVYKLALEENVCFSSRYHGNGYAKTELGSSLLLVLEELKKNYNSMRVKIKMGIPLNALPPLSVEINLFPISSSYVPCKLFSEDLCYDSVSGMRKADFEALKLQETNTSVNVDNTQIVYLTGGGQPSGSSSSKTLQGQRKDQDVQHGYVKTEDGNEYWFDAKEELTVAEFSVISEEMEEQQEKQDTVDLREAKIRESVNKSFFVCVGGLSSSVSEGDLRSHFRKYQISDILICVDSGNHRCAFLGFKDANEAKLAVEEMSKKQIKGKTISVELVNDSSENKYSVSQILKKKLWREFHSVNDSQRKDQDKSLSSASNSVEAPDTTCASEKAPLLPTAALKIPCSTQAPLETKCSGPKSSVEESDTGGNSLQKASAPFSTNSFGAFISPNTLNLSSFTKLMKKLQEIHPEASRDKIVDALLEVRKNNKGILSGLSINSIMERTSVILRKSTPSCSRGESNVNK